MPSGNYFQDKNLILVWIFATDRQKGRQTNRQTQSDAYETTVQVAQVGSNKGQEKRKKHENPLALMLL